jgi:enoyl-CoA hydratase/carnithine racemase
MELKNLIMDKRGHVRIVTINRPPSNAWTLEAFLEFESVLDELENDRETRVVVITGAGDKCFSSGFDVNDYANVDKSTPKGQELFRRVDRFPKPTIAAINGYALGGGCELAMACHFRIMADNPKAKIGCTELNLGVIPAWGGILMMTRILGRAKALDMILLGKKITAREALEIGLVDKVTDSENLIRDAMEYADLLAARPPIAVACVLKAVSAGIYEGVDRALKIDLESVEMLSRTRDAEEGVRAFLEKRPPVFKGE